MRAHRGINSASNIQSAWWKPACPCILGEWINVYWCTSLRIRWSTCNSLALRSLKLHEICLPFAANCVCQANLSTELLHASLAIASLNCELNWWVTSSARQQVLLPTGENVNFTLSRAQFNGIVKLTTNSRFFNNSPLLMNATAWKTTDPCRFYSQTVFGHERGCWIVYSTCTNDSWPAGECSLVFEVFNFNFTSILFFILHMVAALNGSPAWPLSSIYAEFTC